jgi:N-acetylneuraminic acid mutarotase
MNTLEYLILGWSKSGSMINARFDHTATVLQNGKVLVAGGYNGSHVISSAELYDPSTGTWTTTGSMSYIRFRHTASLLANGKVLVAGGFDINTSLRV